MLSWKRIRFQLINIICSNINMLEQIHATRSGHDPLPNDISKMKHSITIAGHRTSISLEEEFWDALCKFAREDGLSVNALVGAIDKQRTTNLSSAIRVFVLNRYQSAST